MAYLVYCTVDRFSGILRDKQLKPKPIEWIDSLEDLYNWKDIRIVTHELSNFNIYLENFKGDPVVDNFRERKNVTEGKLIYEDNRVIVNQIDFNAVEEGKLAIVWNNDYLEIFKQNLISDGFREDIDFHIAQSEGQSAFLISGYTLLQEQYAQVLNMV